MLQILLFRGYSLAPNVTHDPIETRLQNWIMLEKQIPQNRFPSSDDSISKIRIQTPGSVSGKILIKHRVYRLCHNKGLLNH